MSIIGFEEKELGDSECGLSFNPNFLTKVEADSLLQWALNDIQFEDLVLNVFGEKTPERKTIPFGDKGTKYSYSGTTCTPKEWPKELLGIKKRLAELHPQGIEPTFTLGSLYKKGTATIGWHSDDEKDLVDDSPIYSLTVGAERDFMVRAKEKAKRQKKNITIPLSHGSLCIMSGKFQSRFQHHIPVRKRCKTPRVNFTFRYIKIR